MSDDFPSTKWTILHKLQNRGTLSTEEEAAAALEYICTCYWRPIRAHLRYLGKSEEDADDLTQGFFAHLVEKKILMKADSGRGRLRTFLIAALNQHIVADWRRNRSEKRGRDIEFVAYDSLAPLPDSAEGTDHAKFDRVWAELVFERSLAALERFYRAKGKKDLIEGLAPYLGKFDEGADEMAPLADQLGITLSALRVYLHRARKRFGDCLRDELRALQTPEEDIEDELRYLVSILES